MSTIDVFYKLEYHMQFANELLGLVGNTLMIIVYSQASSLRALSVSVYFRCAAIVCVCRHLHNLIMSLMANPEITNTSQLACKLVVYLQVLVEPLVAWFELVAGLDRFLTIVFPARFAFIKRARVKLLVAGAVIAYNMAFYSSILVRSRLVDSDGEIWCETHFRAEISIIDFVNGSLLPFILMVILSFATLVGVLKARSHATHTHFRITNDELKRARARKNRDLKFGVTMLVLNFSFFLLNFPSRLVYATNFNPFDFETQQHACVMFGLLVNDIHQIYFSSLFYVQLLVNSLVRKRCFFMLFACIGAVRRWLQKNVSQNELS